MKKRTAKIISLIFAFLLFTSVVYAQANGTLKLEGYAALNGNLLIEFTNASILGARTSESINYQIGYMASNRYRINASLYLAYPGDVRVIEFYIRNMGSTRAVLGDWNVTMQTGAGPELKVIFLELKGRIIPTATTQGPFDIYVNWNASYPEANVGPRHFSATIDYHI